MQKRGFLDAKDYPIINALEANWRRIREEVLPLLQQMTSVRGPWADGPCWHYLPLLVEDDDRNYQIDFIVERMSSHFPVTRRVLGHFEQCEAVAFSKLDAGGRIKAHAHERPFTTLALCLEGGSDCKIRVGGEWASYQDGKCLAFDYTYSHEVINGGSADRLVLLVLVARDARCNPFGSLLGARRF